MIGDAPYEDQTYSVWRKEIMTFTTAKPKTAKKRYANSSWILIPEEGFMIIWSKVIMVVILFTTIISPYRVSFVDQDPPEWQIIDLVVDGLYFIDVMVNCFLAYTNADNVLVTSNKKIILHYLSTWMILDTFSCIPLELLITGWNYHLLAKLSRLPRIYRLIKITKLFRLAKFAKNRDQTFKYVNLLLRINTAIERLIWFLLSFIVLIHLICCLWVFAGRWNLNISTNWIQNFGFQDYDNMNLYIVSLYWTVTTLATVGYGDIVATNTTERIVASFVMIIGIWLYSYGVGSLTNLIGNLDTRRAKLNRQLEVLQRIAREYKLNKVFFKKLTNALEYDNSQSRKDVDELIEDLPPSLRKGLLIITYEGMIRHNAFFTNKQSHFVAWVAPKLKPLKVAKGDMIYKAGEYATEMYFLVKGEVAMVIMIDDVIIPFILLSPGYYFGEVDLLFSESKTHLHTVKATDHCELLAFSKEDFEQMMQLYEEESNEICMLASERLFRTDEKMKEAEESYKKSAKVKSQLSYPRPKKSRWDMDKFKNAYGKKAVESNLSLIKTEDTVNIDQSVKESLRRNLRDKSIGKSLHNLFDSKVSESSNVPIIKQKIFKMNKSMKQIQNLCKILMEKANPNNESKEVIVESQNKDEEKPLLKKFLNPWKIEIEADIEERHMESEVSRIEESGIKKNNSFEIEESGVKKNNSFENE